MSWSNPMGPGWLQGLSALGNVAQGYNQQRERERRMAMEDFKLREMIREAKQQQDASAGLWGALSQPGQAVPIPMAGGGASPMSSGGAPDMMAVPSLRAPTMPGTDLGVGGGGLLERFLRTTARDESGDRNIMQGIVPESVSTASSPYQITNTTLRDTTAGQGYRRAMDMPGPLQDKAAVELAAQRGTQPWAPYNPKLRRDLDSQGITSEAVRGEAQEALRTGNIPQIHPAVAKAIGKDNAAFAENAGVDTAGIQQARAGVERVAQATPMQYRGSMSLDDMVARVNKAMPSADAATKGMAIQMMQKFLAPQQQQEWEQHKFQVGQQEKTREFDIREGDLREQRRATLNRSRSGDVEVLTDPSNNQQYVYDKAKRQATTLSGEPYTPGGARKITGQPRNAPAMATQKFLEENPNATSDDIVRFQGKYRREQAIQSSFGGGMAGRNLVALNTVADHLGLLRDYADALRNNDVPRANQVLNVISKETGHPEVVDFNTARIVAADEIVRLLTSTGGTEQDRKDMQAVFDTANSPEQLAGAINTAHRFVVGRLHALEQQYARNDPARRKEFEEEMLSPEARVVFNKTMPSGSQPQGTPMSPGVPAQTPQAAPAPQGGPPPGAVENGYRFKGGDPADPNSWDRVQ